jgi:hypothetical protein
LRRQPEELLTEHQIGCRLTEHQIGCRFKGGKVSLMFVAKRPIALRMLSSG